jgi:hypothetical protein
MLKKSSLKLLGQMEPNLAGSIYVRSSKTSSFGSIRPTNMAAVTKNRTYGKISYRTDDGRQVMAIPHIGSGELKRTNKCTAQNTID